MKLNSKELRVSAPSVDDVKSIQRNPVYLVLDNVIDTYNVGAIFRLADAAGVEKVYLCGETLTPPNIRIAKASVGTYKWTPWQYASTAVEAIANIKEQIAKSKDKAVDLKVIAAEQSERSVPYYEIKPSFPVALVVGHETYGVSKEVLHSADYIAEIPMWGINKSMNVMVSTAIVLFDLMKHVSQ